MRYLIEGSAYIHTFIPTEILSSKEIHVLFRKAYGAVRSSSRSTVHSPLVIASHSYDTPKWVSFRIQYLTHILAPLNTNYSSSRKMQLRKGCTCLRSIGIGSFSIVSDLGTFSDSSFKVNLYALAGKDTKIFCFGAPNPIIKSTKLSVFSISKSPIRREG